MNKKQLSLLGLCLVVVVLGLAACGVKEPEVGVNKEPYAEEQFLMGTYVDIKIFDDGKQAVLTEAFKRVKLLADKITVNESGSEIDEINKQAGLKAVKVSKDVYPLVKKAYEYSEASDDGFDLSIGPITQLWHIGFADARKPQQTEINQALSLVNHEEVVLDDKNQTVFLKKKGMELDLGAIAKGYITDEVVKVLKAHDVTTAIVDLGGNIYVLGTSPRRENSEWNVGIQDPNQARNTIVGSVPASNQSLVTSGIYERNLTVGEEVFHHLFNPKTGYPFDNELAGVTIISGQSIDGDALSTVVFSMGLKEGMVHIQQLKDVEAIFVTVDDHIYLSQGLKDTFKLKEDAPYKISEIKNLNE